MLIGSKQLKLYHWLNTYFSLLRSTAEQRPPPKTNQPSRSWAVRLHLVTRISMTTANVRGPWWVIKNRLEEFALSHHACLAGWWNTYKNTKYKNTYNQTQNFLSFWRRLCVGSLWNRTIIKNAYKPRSLFLDIIYNILNDFTEVLLY